MIAAVGIQERSDIIGSEIRYASYPEQYAFKFEFVVIALSSLDLEVIALI